MSKKIKFKIWNSLDKKMILPSDDGVFRTKLCGYEVSIMINGFCKAAILGSAGAHMRYANFLQVIDHDIEFTEAGIAGNAFEPMTSEIIEQSNK